MKVSSKMAETNLINRRITVGMDMVAPYGVYVNNEQVALYESISDASRHYRNLQQSLMTPIQRKRERDRIRTALQSPLSANKSCVLYLKEKKEFRTAWFYRPENAQRALQIMAQKYGEKNAVIYCD